MLNKKRSRIGSIISAALGALVLISSGWVVLNAQYVFDRWSVWQYRPSAAIASIYDRSGMSENGKFYFYASNPVVNSPKEFNDNCRRQELKSAILGCYSMGKVYIRDITNSELDGIEEVTAAHETLHVIWDRMTGKEKQSVGVLLEADYQKIKNPVLDERMAYYERTEPGERLNELHSIIGTETADIGSELDAYYRQYFTDRSKIVALHSGYQQLFDSIQTQSDAMLVEVNTLTAELKTNIAQYNSDVAVINTQSDELRDRSNSVDRTSSFEVNKYNTTRQALLVRINELRALRTAIDAKFEVYNTKLAQYNQLVVRSNELTESLDGGTLALPPSL